MAALEHKPNQRDPSSLNQALFEARSSFAMEHRLRLLQQAEERLNAILGHLQQSFVNSTVAEGEITRVPFLPKH
jgi:hypothetical protein